jgi:phosphinothricin acetyltransferase
MSERTIRLATAGDSDAILEIYAPYIRDTAISFETEVPTRGAFRQRVVSILEHYPYLVCEENGSIVGFAYASSYRERAAYRYDVSVSIYLRHDCQSRGVGSGLYDVLLDLLRRQGYYMAVSGITLPNEKSLRLHLRHGFREVGVTHNVGYKLGKWHDVLWMEKAIGDYAAEPGPIRRSARFGRVQRTRPWSSAPNRAKGSQTL